MSWRSSKGYVAGSHWRTLCLLAHDKGGCSIQPEIFAHQKFARAGI